MTATNKLRVATVDTEHAVGIACSEIEAAVGLPVRADLQEIENSSVILELEVGNESIHTPHPSRLAAVVDKSASAVEVLSSWAESAGAEPTPRRCLDVIGVGYEPLPPVAQRSIDDALPTAWWDREDSSWHLAVPSVCRGKAIVGLERRSGYSHRFTAYDAAAVRCGLHSTNERFRLNLRESILR